MKLYKQYKGEVQMLNEKRLLSGNFINEVNVEYKIRCDLQH
jgi:hypothetical protein